MGGATPRQVVLGCIRQAEAEAGAGAGEMDQL